MIGGRGMLSNLQKKSRILGDIERIVIYREIWSEILNQRQEIYYLQAGDRELTPEIRSLAIKLRGLESMLKLNYKMSYHALPQMN